MVSWKEHPGGDAQFQEHEFRTPQMYSGLSSELVIPVVGKEMVEKLWLTERSCCAIPTPPPLTTYVSSVYVLYYLFPFL